MELTSEAFGNEAVIGPRHGADGKETSPPLSFAGVPAGTTSLVLIVEDLDGPDTLRCHWVYFNLPGKLDGLPEGVEPEETPAPGGRQGTNDQGSLGYIGPRPSNGTHRYVFHLYALDTMLDLAAGATRDDVERAMVGHVLEEARLMGRYARPV
jgi:Raf kinase inhibitor-like YbhB/YbcL family protein